MLGRKNHGGERTLIEKSLTINSRLMASLEKSVKAKQMLDIGWTRDDQEVLKNGEMGLCPNLISDRVRALGRLGFGPPHSMKVVNSYYMAKQPVSSSSKHRRRYASQRLRRRLHLG